MNYREKMREYIECPQFGNIDYGKWGALNIEQRKLIKRLLDEMDRADECIKKMFFEKENLQSKIDKANEIINKLCVYKPYGYENANARPIKNTTKQEVYNAIYDLRDILKEDK